MTAALPVELKSGEARRGVSARLRWRTLRRLEEHLDLPMAVLAVAWIALLAIDLVRGSSRILTLLATAIWVVFIAEFILKLVLAPDRWRFMKRSWLTVVSLVIPALRATRLFAAFRAVRAARAIRGVRLIRTVGALNRGMSALGATLRRTGVWYVVALTIIVCLAGAAGMYALEPHDSAGSGFSSYADALWWTAMLMTTMGSDYWPQTGEARILAFLISLLAIGVFGYVTAMLASFLVGRDAAASDGSTASALDMRALRREIAAMRAELREFRAASNDPASKG